ncbi:type II toxin-antitoxin system VapC family toxin [Pseudonocardia sp. KRD-184]|uniref:Ribonuclease VapC n=1 Tax=Pseudonocardia oceani TaxID=2792013 RepID=A0ABS6U3J3_9PSEU|nr:type II toxin-antitoxin system VapC family toxin [Pseudonocardia oceani]MBW0093210.1 type II toxin-antitoxin system VapC family toxin [Pseudonocardia oceani]MBW0100762.1 type II toxin-antitoxin system VapC family toxin [Pseudonocardia oceani]MBW0112624.1 type II toxin-antitoxin system VapC family toxin [Pseudonocardia oceani]MBW0126812.1 type II toxin-antitoxin system VapC family toxin [Pseudonocardia oceani]
MIVLYADTSAVVGAYLADEPGHDELAATVFDGADPVVTSELTRVEFASAVTAAVRARRLEEGTALLDRFDADCGDGGPLLMLGFDAAQVLPLARRLVVEHRLRTLDALHLAAALTAVPALADEVVLLSRDVRQVRAAAELGLAVR